MTRAGLAALALGTSLYYASRWHWIDAFGWFPPSSFPLPFAFAFPTTFPSRLIPALLFALKILVAGGLSVHYPLTSSLAPVAGLTFRFGHHLSKGWPAGPLPLWPPPPGALDPLHLAIQFVAAGVVARCVTSASSSSRSSVAQQRSRGRRTRRRGQGIRLWTRARTILGKSVRRFKGGVACVLRALHRLVERFLARADPYLRAWEDRYLEEDGDGAHPDEYGHDDDEADELLLVADGEEEDGQSFDDDDEEEYVDDEDEAGDARISSGGRAVLRNDVEQIVLRFGIEFRDEDDDDDEEGGGEGHDGAEGARLGDDPSQPPPPDGPPEGGDEEPPRDDGADMGDHNHQHVEEILDSDDEDE